MLFRSNPVCRIAPDSFYEALIPWAKAHNIIIVHDNAYSDIIYDGHTGKSILQFEGAKENCIEFYSLSKSYNYTGARAGFLVGNETLVQNFKKLRSQIDYGTFLPQSRPGTGHTTIVKNLQATSTNIQASGFTLTIINLSIFSVFERYPREPRQQA